jgi:hypothetical protein
MAHLLISKRHFLATGLASLLPMPVFAAPAIVTVPIRIYRDRAAVIPVTLNGQGPFPFALATGSPLNVIDYDLATELSLAPVNQIKNFFLQSRTVSLGSENKEIDVTCPSVKIGDYDLKTRVFDTQRLKPEDEAEHLRHRNRADYPRGVMGTNMFVETCCLIDFAAGQLSLYPEGGLDVSGFTNLDAKIGDTDLAHDKSITVPAKLDGETLTCYIDSSGNTELYLTSKYVKTHDLYGRFTDFTDVPHDVKDPSKGSARVVRMRHFQFGGMSFDEINVTLGDPRHSDRLGEAGVKAVIGRKLLAQGSLAFRDNAVYIKPNAMFTPFSPAYVLPDMSDD